MDTILGTTHPQHPLALGKAQPAELVRRHVLERVQHEIRTPLATLLGHAELLSESEEDLPYRVEFSVRAINRAADRLTALLAELDEAVTAPAVAG